MANPTKIRVPAMSGMTTDGGSFDREMAGVLWRRTRLIFLIGLIASSVVFVFNRIYGLEPIAPPLVPWREPTHLIHPLTFAIGLLLVHRGERTLERIQWIALIVVAVNLAMVIPAVGAFYPQREAFLPVALLLFVTAAFLPCPRVQHWLGGLAVAMSLVAEFVLPAVIPEVGAYWAGLGARMALFEHLWRITGVVLIAAVSSVISTRLHHLHRSAHKAERLGNYLIEKELGHGGMGQVFVARHAMICRPTAIKVMSRSEDDGQTESSLARFEREVQLSASLTHPNTITIFDFGRTADDTFYYAMEYLEGMDLDSMIEKFGPLPPERVLYFLRQVCGSLGEAHGRGIVHRDIKPSNIFITHRGGLYDFVKVLDFGLARKVRHSEETGLTKTGVVLGTPRYIAPESLYGARQADARSDLYNLGGVAYWMLTGKPLFPGASSVDLIIDHVKTIPEPPSAVAEQEVPEELDRLIMKLLEKEPEDRYQSAEEVLKALQAIRLPASWSQERAREWWDVHAPEMVARAKPEEGATLADTDRKVEVAVTA
ncbi:MAG: protein kinase [Gemmatimonadetes bacterium]|nr:protein kinase [Gemmatimonadota bacterium]